MICAGLPEFHYDVAFALMRGIKELANIQDFSRKVRERSAEGSRKGDPKLANSGPASTPTCGAALVEPSL